VSYGLGGQVTARGLMNWMVLAVALIGWCLIGLGVAYLFGRFTSGVETQDNADGVALPVVGYLRRSKRTRGVTPLRAVAQPRRRVSGG
jgi:hypothetical protein